MLHMFAVIGTQCGFFIFIVSYFKFLLGPLCPLFRYVSIFVSELWKVIVYFMRLTENILEDTTFNGFPLVADPNSQILCGYIARRDLKIVLSMSQVSLIGLALVSVYFSNFYLMIIEPMSKQQIIRKTKEWAIVIIFLWRSCLAFVPSGIFNTLLRISAIAMLAYGRTRRWGWNGFNWY